MAYKGGAHIVVLGNEKGGSGKSTTAMHVAAALIKLGHSVAALDLDLRQQSFGRYLENRRAFAAKQGARLAIPEFLTLRPSDEPDREAGRAEEKGRLHDALDDLAARHDFVVVDCPGSDSWYSRCAHAHADTLITPMNDSFIDFDLLAKVDSDTWEIKGPSFYSEMVWESRKARAIADRGSIDWIVMRNRIAHLDAKNKRRVGALLDKLARRIGFRLAPGFGERVIYRELFLKGLTLLDLREPGSDVSLTMSHVAARQEVRSLVATLNLPLREPLRIAEAAE